MTEFLELEEELERNTVVYIIKLMKENLTTTTTSVARCIITS